MRSFGKVLAVVGAGVLALMTVIVLNAGEYANPQFSPDRCEQFAVEDSDNSRLAGLCGAVVQSYWKVSDAWRLN